MYTSFMLKEKEKEKEGTGKLTEKDTQLNCKKQERKREGRVRVRGGGKNNHRGVHSILLCPLPQEGEQNKRGANMEKKQKRASDCECVCLEVSLGMLNGNLRLILRLAANLFRDLDLIQVGRQIVVNIFKKTLLIFFNL